MDDALQKNFLCRDERESGCEIEAHLMTEHAQCADARTVVALHTVFAHAAHQIEILLHAGLRTPKSSTIPTTIIGIDNNWPIVTQSSAMKPMCASGSRNHSVVNRSAPYATRNTPVAAPVGRGFAVNSHRIANNTIPSANA